MVPSPRSLPWAVCCITFGNVGLLCQAMAGALCCMAEIFMLLVLLLALLLLLFLKLKQSFPSS